MNTLEDIMRGVTLDVFIAGNGLTIDERKFLLRCARNFAPLVRALQDMLEVAWPNESQPDSRTNRAIEQGRKALNQALADEP